MEGATKASVLAESWPLLAAEGLLWARAGRISACARDGCLGLSCGRTSFCLPRFSCALEGGK